MPCRWASVLVHSAVVMRNALTVLVKGLGRKLQKAGITSGHQQKS